MIFGTEKSNLKKSLTGGVGNWLVWTHFWIPYAILVLKMGVCTQEATSNEFQALRTVWLQQQTLCSSTNCYIKNKTQKYKTVQQLCYMNF